MESIDVQNLLLFPVLDMELGMKVVERKGLTIRFRVLAEGGIWWKTEGIGIQNLLFFPVLDMELGMKVVEWKGLDFEI